MFFPFIIVSLLSGLNFGSIFGFIRKNWQIISLVLLITGSYWYVNSLQNTIADLQNEVTKLKVANAFCENNKAALQQALDSQNGKIQKWAKVGRDSKEKFEKLKAEIEHKRKLAEIEVNKILQEKKPESCQAAIDYLVDGKKDITWSEKH